MTPKTTDTNTETKKFHESLSVKHLAEILSIIILFSILKSIHALDGTYQPMIWGYLCLISLSFWAITLIESFSATFSEIREDVESALEEGET